MKGCLQLLLGVEELLVTPLVFGVGFYSLSSSISLASPPLDKILGPTCIGLSSFFHFPLACFSSYVFLFSLMFSSLGVSIYAASRFLYSANSCCIFTCTLKITSISIEGSSPLASTTFLLVDTIVASSLHDICRPYGVANCSCRLRNIL